jgi:hypothetical protein
MGVGPSLPNRRSYATRAPVEQFLTVSLSSATVFFKDTIGYQFLPQGVFNVSIGALGFFSTHGGLDAFVQFRCQPERCPNLRNVVLVFWRSSHAGNQYRRRSEKVKEEIIQQ